MCRPQHESWQESDPLSRCHERLGHLAIVDAIGDVRVETLVAAAAVDHAEAGAVGPEVSQERVLFAQVGEANLPPAFEPVAARHDDVEGIVEEVNEGEVITDAEPPTDAVMPPMDEAVRLFAGYGAEILGPPLSLSEFS